ncbi:MAG TPA: hypothetical protein VGO11_09135 [Chthoniobacteraceae bacterium]|jgi:hypothetical protein|nr:hypothetical protein [Chthoniobacteraceae bacterium]
MKTSSEWLRYYQQNPDQLLHIPWYLGAELTAEERAAITRSVQEFQLGESSEGRHLLLDAADYAARTGDHLYLQTMRLFIAEEQRHAADLARFLQLNGLPVVQSTWGDCVFRQARNLFPGLELSITVLVCAELIAKVYYAALRKATGSLILQRLCEQILRDEVSHVAFQTEQLARLRARRGRSAHAITMAAQRLAYLGAVCVVWVSHRRVMQRAGMDATGWWKACWREFGPAFSRALRAQARAAVAGESGEARPARSAFAAEGPM